MTTNHQEDIFSSVTSRGAALWRSFSSSKMQQVQYETSMKNIPLGGNKEYVMQLTKSVRKVVTTQWNKRTCYTACIEELTKWRKQLLQTSS